MLEQISDEGVWRTALATLGLLIIDNLGHVNGGKSFKVALDGFKTLFPLSRSCEKEIKIITLIGIFQR